jgi:hypothetical protein
MGLQPFDGAIEAAAAGGDHQVDRGVGLAIAEVADPARRGVQVGATLFQRSPARRRPPHRHCLPRPCGPLAGLRQPQRWEPAVQRRQRAVVQGAEAGLLQVVRASRRAIVRRGGAGTAVRVLAGQPERCELGVEAGDRIGRELGQVGEPRILECVRGQPAVRLTCGGMDRRWHDRLGAVQEQLDQGRPTSPAVVGGDADVRMIPANAGAEPFAAGPGAVIAHPPLLPATADRRRAQGGHHGDGDVGAIGVDVGADELPMRDADAGVGPALPALVQELRRHARAPVLPARHVRPAPGLEVARDLFATFRRHGVVAHVAEAPRRQRVGGRLGDHGQNGTWASAWRCNSAR